MYMLKTGHDTTGSKHIHLFWCSQRLIYAGWENIPEPKNVLRFYLNDFILVLV